jgi:hypothetical protein
LSAGWSWLALAGLGAFHGVNPAMGWLFAVALGLHRGRRAIVLQSLVPIAIGHAAAVAVVAVAVGALGVVVEETVIRVTAGLALLGWAGYQWLYGSRHRVRVGMRTGLAGLALWSFLMATAHGAGLMLVPVLLSLEHAGAHAGHAGAVLAGGHSLGMTLTAVAVHSAAMLAVTGAIAIAVYEWIGVAFLRRGWINLDRLWQLALVATGLLLLATAFR